MVVDMVLIQMRMGYIRPDKLMGEAPQRQVLLDSGIPAKHIYVETDSKEQPILEWIIDRKMRPNDHDTVEVSDLHRLCSNTDCMVEAIERISARNGSVVDVRTGASSEKAGAFARALAGSIGVLSGRLSRSDRRRIGKMGAEASPVTKSKSVSLPLHRIDAIMDDHDLSIGDAVAKIRREFKAKAPSIATIHRWRREGKLKFRRRLAGPIPKT